MLKEINLDLKIKIETNKNSSDLIIVNSHERSGTHFLMNSIDHCFQFYKSKPFLNLDLIRLCSVVNFYDSKSLSNFFEQLIIQKNSSIIKSHFNAEFFYNLDEATLNKIKFLFIYREPISVLKSFWIFINNCNWYEGPKINNFKEFCFSQPGGQVLRYQYSQYENFISRYLHMLNGWFNFKKKNKNIYFVSYDELNANYPEVIEKIGKFLNMKAINKIKYDRKEFFEVKFNKYLSNLIFDPKDTEAINEYINNKAKNLELNSFINLKKINY